MSGPYVQLNPLYLVTRSHGRGKIFAFVKCHKVQRFRPVQTQRAKPTSAPLDTLHPICSCLFLSRLGRLRSLVLHLLYHIIAGVDLASIGFNLC